MYSIAPDVIRWLSEGRTVQVAQIVATRGFSSRDPGAALAWTSDGARAGALILGLDDVLANSGEQLSGRLAQLTVSDADAEAAGLSCGGDATVLVQDAAAYPPQVWTMLERRSPMCLVSEIVGDQPARTSVYTAADVRDAVGGPLDLPRLFARGTSATELATDGDTSVAVAALWPATRMVVAGAGTIAAALEAGGRLLGWQVDVTEDPEQVAVLAETLAESDAFVVLSHDRAVDIPALAAVLAGRAGYVGALGSRGTQAARREGLVARGVDEQALARIHGPAGLDIDAHTPAEIAVSIVAEIIATRSGSSGGSIRDRGRPVHTGGVHAPPPRY